MPQLKFFKLFIIYLFLGLTLKPLAAQNKVQIKGVVTDQNNNPIELVSVSIKDTNRGTTTNYNGSYKIDNNIQDSITLHFSNIGYQSEEYTIPCTKNYTLMVNLKSISHQIADITISKDRAEEIKMIKLDAITTQIMPSTSGNAVQDLLVTMPGVSSNNEMSSQYSVRGGNFDENLVYVNGIEIYRPLLVRSGQQEGLSFINPTLVSNISFSSGGFDAQYGDKMSSVLDIKYRIPTEFAATASVSLLGASAHLESISKNKKFTQIHGLRYKQSSYLLNSLDTDGEYKPSFLDYQTLLRYRFNDNWSVSLLGNYSFNRYIFVPETRETEYGTQNMIQRVTIYFDGWENDLFQSLTAAASVNYTPTSDSKYKLTLSTYKTDENENFDISGEYWINEVGEGSEPSNAGDSIKNIGVGGYMQHARNELDINVNTLTISGSHSLDDGKHLLSWGNTFQHEYIHDDILEWTLRDSSGYSQSGKNGGLEMYKYYRTKNQIQAFRSHGYVQDSYRKSRISLTYGVRYSYWSFNNELTVSPRASFVFAANENNYLRLSAGRYVQTPFYKEIRTREGDLNHDIKSQKSINFAVGYDNFFKMWNRPFKYTVEAYYKHMRDLIPYDVDNVRIEYYGDNMAKGYAVGVENRIYGEFVPGVDSWLGLTIMKTAEKLDGTDKYIPRPTDQRYNFTMFFQDYLPKNDKYKTHLRLIFGDGLPFTSPNSYKEHGFLKSKPYQRVDWGLSRVFTNDKMENGILKKIWVDFEILNLFGINNANSYFWVTDIHSNNYAVPNYLTGRRFNLKISAHF